MPNNLMSTIAGGLDVETFRTLNWEGSFDEYLDMVVKDPRITRNAYQRLYDMILSHGTDDYTPRDSHPEVRRLFCASPLPLPNDDGFPPGD